MLGQRAPEAARTAAGTIRRAPDPLTWDLLVARGRWKRRYHFPGAVRLPGGTLLVAARSGVEHVDHRGRIEVFRSTDEGRTWTGPHTARDSRGDDRDPKLAVTPTGRVLLTGFTRRDDRSRGPVRTGVFVLRSDDDGRTWDVPTLLAAPGADHLTSHGAATIAADGSVLLPVYARNLAMVMRSTDDGLTFPPEQVVVLDCAGAQTTEVVLLALRSGLLLAWVRLADERLGSLLLRSEDSGASWSAPEHLPIAQSSADMVELDDGRVLVAFGDLSGRFGVRRVTCAALVDDPAGPWPATAPAPVWDAINFDQANPSLVALPDGDVLMFVTDYTRRALVGKRLKADELRAAPSDARQQEGAVDLLALVDAGRALVRTDMRGRAVTDSPDDTLGPLRPGLGLDDAVLGAAAPGVCGHYTVMFERPLEVREVGVALRPGEDQRAWVGVADGDGLWHRLGRLPHGWRFGDVDWLPLPAPLSVHGVRVVTESNRSPRPPKARATPEVAVTRLMVR